MIINFRDTINPYQNEKPGEESYLFEKIKVIDDSHDNGEKGTLPYLFQPLFEIPF